MTSATTRPNLHDAVWAAGILVIIVMSVFQVYDVLRRQDIVLESTQRELETAARLLAEHTAASLQAVDVLLREYHAWPGSQSTPYDTALQKGLRERIRQLPQLRDLTVVPRDLSSAGGKEAVPGTPLPPEVLAWLQAAPKGDELRISDPFFVSGAGALTAVLSRRFESGDGHASGSIVAYLDLEYFRRFYGGLELPPGSRTSLLGSHGRLLVEYPSDPIRPSAPSPVYQSLLTATGGGSKLLVDPQDGIERIYAAQAVPGFPLAIGLSTTKSDLLAPWYVQSTHSAARTASLCASIALLMWLVLRQLRRREQVEARLRVQTASLDELFESAPEAIAMLDLNGGIARVNREFTRLFGYSPEEARGHRLEQLIVPQAFQQEAQRMALAVQQGEHVISETERQRSDGSRLMVSALSAPIVDAAGPVASYAIFRDVTERRQAESERAKLEARLRQAEKLEAIGTMAGGIAHDFNSILSAILGYGNLALQNAEERDAVKRYLTSILSAADRGRGLVDQILTYSRSTRGRRVLVKVHDLLQDTLELVRTALPGNIELKIRLTAQDAYVVADPTHIHQLVMNLCSNALHSMQQGGRLEVELDRLDNHAPRELSHGALSAARYLVLRVRDNGCGIPQALMPRIFEPFFTTGHAGGGTGLGLAVVYAIMTELNGAIDVHTVSGNGSTFTLYLPAADPPTFESVNEENELPRGSGERVLLVEDEQALMLLEEEMLAALNYEPAGFIRAPMALAEFLADTSRFDAVLLDQMMPEMTGIELAKRVRAVRDDLPIILITGHAGPALAQEARATGVQEILSKPLDFRLLAQALHRALEGHAAGAPASRS